MEMQKCNVAGQLLPHLGRIIFKICGQTFQKVEVDNETKH